MTGNIVLYDYWRSSAAYRVRIGLNLAGLTYDRHPVDLAAGDQHRAEYLTFNPQGLVPVLMIDGQRLTQSLAILEYLDDTRNTGFLPKDPLARAHARALAYAIAMDIHPICNLRVAQHAVSLGGRATMAGWMNQFITLGLTGLEGLLVQAPETAFCHGDAPGLADICLVPQVYNARRWQVDLAPFPRLAAVAARAEALPAFAHAHPDRVKPA